jgi:hypothetical protein
LSRHIFQDSIAACEFFPDARRPFPHQGWMAHRVVPYQMTGLQYGAGHAGTKADVIANQEEDGADLMLRQKVEQTLGVGIIGAVIESQRDLVNIWTGDQGPAKELRGGNQRCIGVSPNREAGHQTRGNHFGIHVSRV